MIFMYRIRWDRILAVIALICLPLMLHWLGKNISIGGLADVPMLNIICQSDENRGLTLLGILLAGALAILKVLLRTDARDEITDE